MPSISERLFTKESPVEKQEQSVRTDIIDLLAQKLVKDVNKKSEQPLEQIKEQLPSTPEQVRALPFYNSTLDALRYQRDNYLVGSGYASRRQKLRDRGITRSYPFSRMPYDSTALGNIQIIDIGASFIPSPTIKNLLLPIVVSLPSGVLRETITDAVANAIPLAQPQLDRAMKFSILNFMDNPEMRQLIKSRAGGYMSSRDE